MAGAKPIVVLKGNIGKPAVFGWGPGASAAENVADMPTLGPIQKTIQTNAPHGRPVVRRKKRTARRRP